MNVMNHSILIFLHLPKSGGTTLKSVIERQYGSSCIYDIPKYKPREIEDTIKRKRNRLEVVMGHLGFGWHYLLDKPFKYITMLRNPIERIVSLYYFSKKYEWQPYYELANSLSLEEFASIESNREICNYQTALLSGIVQAPTSTRELPQKKHLQEAIENLNTHFINVGITEKFDESILLLQDSLSWEMPFYRRLQVVADRPKIVDLNKRILDTIKRNNELDLELYSWTKQKHNALVAKKGEEFEGRLARFREANVAYEKSE